MGTITSFLVGVILLIGISLMIIGGIGLYFALRKYGNASSYGPKKDAETLLFKWGLCSVLGFIAILSGAGFYKFIFSVAS